MKKRRDVVMRKMLTAVRRHYHAHARRTLPWRKTRDPYRILVSEMMLQQTQVKRVLAFYAEFTRHFPTAQSLSRAPLSRVLLAWQGLGYNRRAHYLHEAARQLATVKTAGLTVEFLETLPGVGPYTARAVSAFAYNRPEVFVETNIRTVFFHHFYANVLQNISIRKITDAELLPLIREALKRSRMEPREFYAALMDYGSYLKQQGIRLNRRSAHYAKQSTFKGSARELRGAILRELLKRPATLAQLVKNLSHKKEEVERELARLQTEKLISNHGRLYDIS